VRVYAIAAKEINRPPLGLLAKQSRENATQKQDQELPKKQRPRIPRQKWRIGSY